MKKLKEFQQKLNNKKIAKIEKKIQAKENRISILKETADCISGIVLPDVTLKIQAKSEYAKKKLNQIQKLLIQAKKTSEIKLEKTSKKLEKQLKALAKKNEKTQGKYDADIQKLQSKIESLVKLQKEKKIKSAENSLTLLKQKKEKSQSVYEAKVVKVEKKASKREQNIQDKLTNKFTNIYEKEWYKVKVKIAHLKHQNKVQNDILWWSNLSFEEQKERKTDLSFYVSNKLGYWLTLISVAAELVYFILLLGKMERTFWVGVSILVNIGFLLLLFTIAIKVKNYKIKFSYVSIAFGLYCILRISYVIHGLMGVDLSKYSTVSLAFIYGANAYMILASLFVGIHSYFKIKHQMKYLNENKITKFQLSK